MSGYDEIGSGCRQFLFDCKFVNSALDNLLVSGGEIFIDFSIKRGVRKLPQSFFLVKVAIQLIYSVVFYVIRHQPIA